MMQHHMYSMHGSQQWLWMQLALGCMLPTFLLCSLSCQSLFLLIMLPQLNGARWASLS
jgi:hypothetical protein